MVSRDSRKLTISIVEDSQIHAEWLKAIFVENEYLSVISSDQCGKEALISIKKNEPNLVVLDFQLRDMTGLEIAKRIKIFSEKIKIFILTAHTESSIIERLICDRNIDAIAIKGSPYFENNFIAAIQRVCRNESYLDPSLLKKLRVSKSSSLNTLTKREFEIFIQIKIGKNDSEIAQDLNIEISHVRNIKSKIFKKIQGDDVGELVRRLIGNITH